MAELKTRTLKCPHCGGDNEFSIPTPDLVDGRGYWDSMRRCPHCQEGFYYQVYPSSKMVFGIEPLENKKL